MLCCFLLTSCQCEKCFTSTVPVLLYLLKVSQPPGNSVCSLYQNFSLLVAFPPFKLQTLYQTIQCLLSQGKLIFWLLIGTSLGIHGISFSYIEKSCIVSCVTVLHRPSLMSSILPHKVNIHKVTKFAQMH